MKKSGVILIIVIFLSGLGVKALGQNPPAFQTQFGTIANFQQYSGSSNFTNGNVYHCVNNSKVLGNFCYQFICPDGQPMVQNSTSSALLELQPDSSTKDWWDFQFRQMINAGLNFVLIDAFGQMPYPCSTCNPNLDYHNCPQEPYLLGAAVTKTVAQENLPLQVGLLVESNSAYQQYNWNFFQNQSLIPTDAWCKYRYSAPGSYTYTSPIGSTTSITIQPMPISPQNFLKNLYYNIIYPFYNNFNSQEARKHWLTHNGQSIANGGRPVIWFYQPNIKNFTDWNQTASAFQALKTQFTSDFGVTPFFIIESPWFTQGSQCACGANTTFVTPDSNVQAIADATACYLPNWLYGSKNPPATNTWTLNNYTISRIIPGLNVLSEQTAAKHWGNAATGLNSIMGKRWMYVDGTVGPDESYFLNREWQSAMKNNPNLAVIGHWDDTEGENITQMANYAQKQGEGYLPPDYYIKKVQALIESVKNGTNQGNQGNQWNPWNEGNPGNQNPPKPPTTSGFDG